MNVGAKEGPVGSRTGTMRDDVNPALAHQTEEELDKNGHVEEEVLEDEEEVEKEEEEKDEDDEILPEHEPDVTKQVLQADGAIITYTIKEMSQGAMTTWMKIWGARIRKKQTVETDKQYSDFLLSMICLCVYGPDGQLVTKQKARSWGHKLKFWMFQKAQEVNGLSDKVVQREGKG